jgi:HEAT repeat protein
MSVVKRTRRRLLVIALVVGVPSLALAFATAPTVRERLTSLLRSIEALPDPAHLDEITGGDGAGAALLALAEDDTANPQARLEAISELAHYPGQVTEVHLRAIIERNKMIRNGASTLYARAAALSLGAIAKNRAVSVIAPLLDHPISDVRADAARALALTGSSEALPPLRARRVIETSAMVKSELADAIGIVTP